MDILKFKCLLHQNATVNRIVKIPFILKIIGIESN